MSAFIRKKFHLTQERLAQGLGLDRTTLAHVEANRRGWPMSQGLQKDRLALAAVGQALLDDTGAAAPAPPPLPPPAVERDPLAWRLKNCRHHVARLRRALQALRQQAAPHEARLAALPALRAWTGTVPDPELETNWLFLFEREALTALRRTCGTGPQLLLAARLAGLEQEVAVLEKALADLPPAPATAG